MKIQFKSMQGFGEEKIQQPKPKSQGMAVRPKKHLFLERGPNEPESSQQRNQFLTTLEGFGTKFTDMSKPKLSVINMKHERQKSSDINSNAKMFQTFAMPPRNLPVAVAPTPTDEQDSRETTGRQFLMQRNVPRTSHTSRYHTLGNTQSILAKILKFTSGDVSELSKDPILLSNFNFVEPNPQLRTVDRALFGTSGLAKDVDVKCESKGTLGQVVCKTLIGVRPTERKKSQLDRNLRSDLTTNDSEFLSGRFLSENGRQTNLFLTSSAMNQTPLSCDHLSKVQNFRAKASSMTPSAVASHGATKRIHTSHNMARLRDKITSKVGDNYSKQIKRQNDIHWKDQTAIAQCAIQHYEEQPSLNRKEIIKSITNKTQENARLKQDSIEAPKKLDQQEERAKQRQQARTQMQNKKLFEQLTSLENVALYNDHDKLHQYIKVNFTRPWYKAENESPTRHAFKSSLVVQYQRQEERIQREAEERAQREAEGDLKDYYKQKELQAFVEMQARQRECLRAMQTNTREAVTSETVAHSMTQTKVDGANYLMERNKPRQTSEERLKQDYVEKVDDHCNEITEVQYLSVFEEELDCPSPSPRMPMSKRIGGGQRAGTPETPSSPGIGFEGNFKAQILALSKLSPKKKALQVTQKKAESIDQRFITSLLRRMTQQNLFGKFVQEAHDYFNMQHVVKRLMDAKGYQELCKKVSNKPMIQGEKYKGDPRNSYFQDCKKAIEPALDIFHQISDFSLQLQGYRLNLGQCQGLKAACMVEDSLIRSCMLDNCGIDDAMLAEILQGLIKQKKVKQLVLKHATIGEKSVPYFEELIGKFTPYNLEELRIEKCNLTQSVMQALLKACENHSHIESLALVDVSLDAENIRALAETITFGGKYLSSIDLSYNKLTLAQITPIVNAICETKKFHSVNLSWNCLTDNSNFGDIGQHSSQLAEFAAQRTNKNRKVIKEIQERDLTKIFGQVEDNYVKKALNENERMIVQNFQSFLKQNNKLMHLDLSECGLTGDMILEISKGIKFCSSLVGVHLSGNPGLSKQVQEKLMNRLSATNEKQFNMASFLQVVHRDETTQNQTKRSKQLLEAIQIKKIKKARKLYEPSHIGMINNAQQRNFILTRKLGHKYDIPGSNEWQAFTESHYQCYICDRKIYSLFLWSPNGGSPVVLESLDLSYEQKQKLANFILNDRESCLKRDALRVIDPELKKEIKPQKKFNEEAGDYLTVASGDESYSLSSGLPTEREQQPDVYVRLQEKLKEMADPNYGAGKDQLEVENHHIKRGDYVPMLFGEFNNWQPQPMVKVSKLVEFLTRDDCPDFISEMKEAGLCGNEVTKVGDMIFQERRAYDKMVEARQKEQSEFKVWARALQKMIQYSQPHCNWAENLQNFDSKSLYITSEFIGCGRVDYAIQYGPRFYFNSTIANFRREEIKIPIMLGKGPDKIPRNPNVFQLWQNDTPDIIENSIRADMEGWKISKFVKDPTDYKNLQQLVRQNYMYLKNVFSSICSRSNYPTMSTTDMSQLLLEGQCIEKVLSQGIVDTQFIASRQDVQERGFKLHNQNKNEINRFEFIECLARIAGCKYKQQGLAHTWSQAFKMLLDQLQQNYQPYPIQMFRDQLLWTRDVNLTFDANKKQILKLYESYSLKSKVGKMSREDAVTLMTLDTKIKLSLKDAETCYVLSLPTCTSLVKTSHIHIDHISVLEFLELIGRVADVFMNESDKPLFEKINYVLDEWLDLVDETRTEPKQFEEGIFEKSDDEAEQMAANKILKLAAKRKKGKKKAK